MLQMEYLVAAVAERMHEKHETKNANDKMLSFCSLSSHIRSATCAYLVLSLNMHVERVKSFRNCQRRMNRNMII